VRVPASTRRRGAILLDAVLSIAIFVASGTAILTWTGRSLTNLERAHLRQQACELARTGMSRLEAGLDTPRTLNGTVKFEDGSSAPPGRWELHVETDQSALTGLAAVAVTARRLEEGRSETVIASYTLRQLVRLGGRAEDKPGDPDPLSALGSASATGGGP
jgi:hypothetical protein